MSGRPIRQRLLDVERAVFIPETDCTDIVLFDPDQCVNCGSADIIEHYVDQPALIRHGGYGATKRSVVRECLGCHWSFVCIGVEIRPERQAS